ncbi:serine/threonine dehydratase [Aliidiomarina shirensis]|uniref:Serine/threonine dehydratase n=1 Tax=Aliidiomarina shirensis TaxID=1048642 RepID=A0A432WVD1_9GAMM|nr:threonine/serine dehydratase [Aliidiomarina shirensis]RUO37722.1 serine/threonine dehydratase [Aliidiomarina shirensis]
MTGWQHIAGPDALNLDLINRAEKLIAPYIVQTPVLESTVLNAIADAQLFFKCENLQRTGAFKFRGAMHALLNLTAEQRKQGVYTVSSGNHGAALAAAGSILDIPVQVAVPSNAPLVKKDNIANNGAEIIEIEPGMAAREAFIEEKQNQSQRIFIPPYNHPLIMAGQGTAALELVKAVPDLDALISPLGGGGLLSGTAMVGHSQNISVFGIEPELANDAYLSLQAGSIQSALPPKSICDGLLTNLGEHTFPVIQDYVNAILLVTEDEVISAMQQLWQALKIIVEPSSATVFAAVCKYPEYFQGKRLGLIISGGNVDVRRLPWPVTLLEKAE